MFIILSGAINAGKTTVCRKLIEILRGRGYTCGGILSRKASTDIIIEDLQSGETAILGSMTTRYPGPCTARFSFNPAGIEFGNKAIEESSHCDVVLVDELGWLELRGEGFTEAFKLVDSGRTKTCLMVIRSELLDAFLPRFKTKPIVCEVTEQNRDSLPQEIAALLTTR